MIDSNQYTLYTARYTEQKVNKEITPMSLNMSPIDRNVRVLLGFILMTFVFIGPQSWLCLIGILPFVTGLSGFCPLYSICKPREEAFYE